MTGERVLGVDGCPSGWVGIAIGEGRPQAYAADGIAALLRVAETDGVISVVAIDIPIGLPDLGQRKADLLARKAVGPLGSSVFPAPVRRAIEADDHATATSINREVAKVGVSIQAFGLKPRIFEVEGWTATTHHRVVEVHPEVSFAAMAGTPLTVRKTTWAGSEWRRELLSRAGITLEGDLGAAGRTTPVNDILDAAVAAWTARRVAHGEANCLPDPPERFSDGWDSAIWV